MGVIDSSRPAELPDFVEQLKFDEAVGLEIGLGSVSGLWSENRIAAKQQANSCSDDANP